jgi:hypothetical protein
MHVFATSDAAVDGADQSRRAKITSSSLNGLEVVKQIVKQLMM